MKRREGVAMTNAWEDWEEYPAECSCGWIGQLGEAAANFDSQLVTELDCPQCSKRLLVLSISTTDEQIRKIADAGGKRAQQHFVDQEKQHRVPTELHELHLEKLGSHTPDVLPKIDGYVSIPEAEFQTHPALVGITSWREDYSPFDHVYAGYSIPVKSEEDEQAVANIAFLYFDFPTGKWVETPGNIATYSRDRQVTWYSENANQTWRDSPQVPVAILLKHNT